MAGKYWTDKEVDVLKKLVEKGVSKYDVMKVFPQRTLPSIECKVCTLGLSFPSGTEINMAEFKRLMGNK
jgi:hypothetical protein